MLYDLRVNIKKHKNPAPIAINLLMNSTYGKTIIKPVETDTVVKYSKYDFENYISLNYNYADSVLYFNGIYYIKQLNQFYHISIMFIVVLKCYQCQT